MLDTMHPALLDRMEIINIAGYTHNEKHHILDNYLYPKAVQMAGLNPAIHKFDIPKDTRDHLI
jgi:ATP-dependent Lon protease